MHLSDFVATKNKLEYNGALSTSSLFLSDYSLSPGSAMKRAPALPAPVLRVDHGRGGAVVTDAGRHGGGELLSRGETVAGPAAAMAEEEEVDDRC